MQANYFRVFHQTKVCIFAFIKNLNLKMICQDLLNLKMFLQTIRLEFACCQTNFFGGHIRKQAWSCSENWASKIELQNLTLKIWASKIEPQKLSLKNWATTIEFQNLIDKKFSFHRSTDSRPGDSKSKGPKFQSPQGSTLQLHVLRSNYTALTIL